MENSKERGKKNRIKGKAFELKVRHDLESKGWIVDRWSNNINLEKNELISAKHTFNPFTRAISAGNGFPDFIAFKRVKIDEWIYSFEIQLVECKTNGKLDKIEKQKIEWIKENLKIPCIVASKEAKSIIYETK